MKQSTRVLGPGGFNFAVLLGRYHFPERSSFNAEL
jgi:hypothetical protein